MRRLVGGLGLAVIPLMLLATTVAAGGWASITADEGTPPQPNAGEEVKLGFNILQHGVTPISWVKATLIATNGSTGQKVSVTAMPEGPEGHYVARVTFPESGFWTWHVEITDLIGESVPSVVTVLAANGTAPSFDPATVLAAVERAKIELRHGYENAIGESIGQYESQISSMRIDIAALRGETKGLADSKAKLQARVDDLEAAAVGVGSGSLPVVAAATIGALAGALAGFGIVVLGRRNEPRATAPGYVPTTR
jgi:hypothetical protein